MSDRSPMRLMRAPPIGANTNSVAVQGSSRNPAPSGPVALRNLQELRQQEHDAIQHHRVAGALLADDEGHRQHQAGRQGRDD